jgi:hypothetical protein
MNKLFYNLFLESSKQPVKRLNPSLLTINVTHNYFKKYRTVSNELYSFSANIEQLHYTKLRHYSPFYVPNKNHKTLFINALDISYLDYVFNSYKLPSYNDYNVEFIDENNINLFYGELQKMKKYYNIDADIDSYKINSDTFIFFNDKYDIIKHDITNDIDLDLNEQQFYNLNYKPNK